MEAEDASRRVYPSNGAPLTNEEDERPPEDGAGFHVEPKDDTTFGDVEDIEGVPPEPVQTDEAGEAIETLSAPLPAAGAAPEAIRALIGEVRQVAPRVARPVHVTQATLAMLEMKLSDIVGHDTGPALTNIERALALKPDGWSVTMWDGAPDGWQVELRKRSDQLGVGIGPSLPCAIVEGVLSAMLSDMGAD